MAKKRLKKKKKGVNSYFILNKNGIKETQEKEGEKEKDEEPYRWILKPQSRTGGRMQRRSKGEETLFELEGEISCAIGF